MAVGHGGWAHDGASRARGVGTFVVLPALVLGAAACSAESPTASPSGTGTPTASSSLYRIPSSGTAKIGSGQVTYADGVAVRVPSAVRYTPSSTAVGNGKGDVGVIVTVTVTNGSKAPLDGPSIIVGVQAAGKFTDQIFDPDKGINAGITGSVPVGGSATGKYAFSVAPSDLASIQVNVNPSLQELQAARFTGPVT